MKIELRKIKISESLSEETTAYTAEIWVDGVLSFYASNHGTGGSDLYQRVGMTTPTEHSVNDWLAANMPPITFDDVGMPEMDPMPCNMEFFVGDLLAKHQREKRLSRMLSQKVVALHPEKKELYSFKLKPTPEFIRKVAERNPDLVVVNGNAEARGIALSLV